MNRRLYFVLPDVQSAERTMDDLLLARIEARRDLDLGKLPEATFLQKPIPSMERKPAWR